MASKSASLLRLAHATGPGKDSSTPTKRKKGGKRGSSNTLVVRRPPVEQNASEDYVVAADEKENTKRPPSRGEALRELAAKRAREAKSDKRQRAQARPRFK